MSTEPGPVRAALRASNSYGLVLILLVLIFLLAPAGNGRPWVAVFIVLLQGTTMLFALHTSRVHPLTMRLAIGLFAIVAILAFSTAIEGTTARPEGTISALAALLLALTPAAMLRRILLSETVDGETIFGALSVYVIFGLFFSALYGAIGAFASTPFFVNTPHPTSGNYQFFSFVTLTTVGYGNLVPAEQLGQSLAVLEALFGQVYLVTLVAALVSRFQPGERLRARSRATEAPPDESGSTLNVNHAPQPAGITTDATER